MASRASLTYSIGSKSADGNEGSTSQSNLLVPPPGIRTRIVHSQTRRVLFSNHRNIHVIWSYGGNETFADQWFSVVPLGQTTYRLVSKFTEEGIYISTDARPIGTHRRRFADQYLELVSGRGSRKGQFRIVCPLNGLAIFCSDTIDSGVGKAKADDSNASHWFSFAFEELEMIDINYDLSANINSSEKPKYISSQTIHNDSEVDLEKTITISGSVRETSTFTFEYNFMIGAEIRGKIGVPLIGEGELSITTEHNFSFAWGKETVIDRTIEGITKVTVRAGKSVKVVGSATESVMDVPFKATWRSTTTAATMVAAGTYHGVQVYGFTIRWTDPSADVEG